MLEFLLDPLGQTAQHTGPDRCRQQPLFIQAVDGFDAPIAVLRPSVRTDHHDIAFRSTCRKVDICPVGLRLGIEHTNFFPRHELGEIHADGIRGVLGIRNQLRKTAHGCLIRISVPHHGLVSQDNLRIVFPVGAGKKVFMHILVIRYFDKPQTVEGADADNIFRKGDIFIGVRQTGKKANRLTLIKLLKVVDNILRILRIDGRIAAIPDQRKDPVVQKLIFIIADDQLDPVGLVVTEIPKDSLCIFAAAGKQNIAHRLRAV